MKKTLLFIMAGLACGAFLASCAAPKYVHKDPAFSYEYPWGYKEDKLMGKDEVARFANQNQYKIPVYTAEVKDREKGLKLADVPKMYLEELPKTYPGSARFKIFEQKLVKLSDGSDAVAVKLKWRYIDKVTYLQSAGVMTYQGDKMIAILGTTIFGGPTTLDKLLEQCMTLTLTP
jgi:hypothetical protein